MQGSRAPARMTAAGALRSLRCAEHTCLFSPSLYPVFAKAARPGASLLPSPGQISQQPCAQGSSDCGKQCDPDYYLDRDGRCKACVTCSGDDLVEKIPCSGNSSRVCECRPGMFCYTSATKSCARCRLHSVCPPGEVVRFQGKYPHPQIGSATSNFSLGSSTPQARPLRTASASSRARTTLPGRGASLTLEDGSEMTRAPSSPSSAARPGASLLPSPGQISQQPCAQGSSDCGKQCDPDYYLDRDGRCKACVTCSGDLVEKTPCTWNSSRVCECRSGMFCTTSATNSCARCTPRSSCPPGTVTKPQGKLSAPPTNGLPSVPLQLDISSPPHWANDLQPQLLTRSDTPISTSTPISFSSTGKPILVSGPVLFWMVVLLVVVLGSVSFLLCHRRACRKWIQQKLYPCYPVQTFRPKLEHPLSTPPPLCPLQLKSVSVVESGTEELGLLSPPAVEASPGGAVCRESMRLLEASPPAGSPSSPRDLPEPPRVTSEHTNNRIEKIYIMKADTVIVGTVRTEVPEGRGLVGLAGPEFEENLEVDHAPRFPEQETEPPLDSCGDAMFSVEEEGKEASLPMTVTEK
uniref:TNF receptor superfamily member 8 n=1 Tax=Neovison vison TaxID=452646 RepID=A0A8C7EPL6_NEOVI